MQSRFPVDPTRSIDNNFDCELRVMKFRSAQFNPSLNTNDLVGISYKKKYYLYLYRSKLSNWIIFNKHAMNSIETHIEFCRPLVHPIKAWRKGFLTEGKKTLAQLFMRDVPERTSKVVATLETSELMRITQSAERPVCTRERKRNLGAFVPFEIAPLDSNCNPRKENFFLTFLYGIVNIFPVNKFAGILWITKRG